MNRHQVAVAAEAFAAGVFAQSGSSVFVQYGANQPGFDLVVTHEQNDGVPRLQTIHVSVKGSQDGGWKLASKEKDNTLETALECWHRDNANYVFCFVQFEGVEAGKMPRLYLATASEVAECLKSHFFGQATGSLIENWKRDSGAYKGQVQAIPDGWKVTSARIAEMFA